MVEWLTSLCSHSIILIIGLPMDVQESMCLVPRLPCLFPPKEGSESGSHVVHPEQHPLKESKTPIPQLME